MSAPAWKGLFEWTMRYSDGTRVSDLTDIEIDPEKMEWLQEVLMNYVKDFVERMKEIQKAFNEKENQELSLHEQESLLDELQEIVESLDQAKNLHLIGGLPMLMELLGSPHASLRWRAAEVVATCVQNNLPVQKLFLKDGVLPLVMKVAKNEEMECRVKGWLAISSMIRNFSEAQRAYMEDYGLEPILYIIKSNNVKLQKRGMLLLEYLIMNGESCKLGEIQKSSTVEMMVAFLQNEDIDVRERCLSLLLAISRRPQGYALVQQVQGLGLAIDQLEKELIELQAEDKEYRQQEISLMTELRGLNMEASEDNSEKTSNVLLLK